MRHQHRVSSSYCRLHDFPSLPVSESCLVSMSYLSLATCIQISISSWESMLQEGGGQSIGKGYWEPDTKPFPNQDNSVHRTCFFNLVRALVESTESFLSGRSHPILPRARVRFRCSAELADQRDLSSVSGSSVFCRCSTTGC